jgi:3-oxoacyl-[acyl-carrier protein] reductase
LRDLDGLDASDFQRIYAVNVIGAFQMVRAFAPLMKGRVGAGVVNVSSIASVMGAGSSIAYVASKGALNALSLSLARALGPEIRVNVVAPGMVDGAWLREGLGAEKFEAFRRGYSARAALNDIVTPRACCRVDLLSVRGRQDDHRRGASGRCGSASGRPVTID